MNLKVTFWFLICQLLLESSISSMLNFCIHIPLFEYFKIYFSVILWPYQSENPFIFILGNIPLLFIWQFSHSILFHFPFLEFNIIQKLDFLLYLFFLKTPIVLEHLLFIFFKFICLFLAVLGLRFCARAFSSCGKRGPLFIAVHGPLTIVTSPVAEHRL